MYQNIWIQKKQDQEIIHLWDDEKGYFTMPYQRYASIKDKNGQFVSLDGSKLRMISNWGKDTPDLYESDIRPDVKPRPGFSC